MEGRKKCCCYAELFPLRGKGGILHELCMSQQVPLITATLLVQKTCGLSYSALWFGRNGHKILNQATLAELE